MIIDVIYFDEGGGHYSSAKIYKDILELNGHSVNILNVIDFTNSSSLREYYSLETEVKNQAVRAFYLNREVDMVVSTMSLLNKDVCTSIKQTNDKIIYVTSISELAETVSGYWIPQGLDQHLIVSTDSLVKTAKAKGYSDDRIHRTSGSIVHRLFYEKNRRSEIREELGFQPDDQVGLVMFGGGVPSFTPQIDSWTKAMIDIKRNLRDKPLMFLCGKNKKAYDLLNSMVAFKNHRHFSNVTNVYDYMNASDYCIGKPGINFLMESLVTGNVVYTANPTIPNPQEFIGLKYINEKQVGVGSENFRHIKEDLEKLFTNFDMYKNNVQLNNNQAVFELPRIVKNIKNSSSQ